MCGPGRRRKARFHGFLITHSEAISIADYLTVWDRTSVRYRPTVHYAYHPCDDAILSLHEFAGKTWAMQPEKRLMMDEIIEGIDELGVLLMGHKKGVYWYGSQLSIHQARELCPHNNATSLQVTAAALAGVIWAIENPTAGIVEPEEMNHERVLEIAARIWASWSAPTATGRRCITGVCCSRRMWIPRTPGSSRTSGWCEECWAFWPDIFFRNATIAGLSEARA